MTETPIQNEKCPCTNQTCPRRKTCAECQAFHKEKGNQPSCQRMKKKEA
jgi:hypothetical protein